MRYLVTPSFSEKLTLAPSHGLAAVRAAVEKIAASSKAELLTTVQAVQQDDVYLFTSPDIHIFLSFGTDAEGDYVLLGDLLLRDGNETRALRPIPSRDPSQNFLLDPHRNMMIDPHRNMMIDPNRNMMVDPFRNMMVDPTRNMMIDPRRNMMIDLQRNMMIDPRRNSMIDPKRNSFINPTSNRLWDGPIVYDLELRPRGFVVRANDSVSLLFNQTADLQHSLVKAGEKNLNVFDRGGGWNSFMVHNSASGYNHFDLNKRWIGFVVWAQ